MSSGRVAITRERLEFDVPFALMWRKDNNSPLLTKLVADVKSMIDWGCRKREVLD